MPFYHALVRPGLLTESARARFSNDVVDVHCRITGAPRSFVHVLITEDSRDKLTEAQNGTVSGTIRSGRTDNQKTEIISGVTASLAALAGVDAGSIDMTSRDIQASYTMEGGALLPEPGSIEEEAWKA